MSTAVTKSSTNTHNARQQEFLRPYYEVTGDRDTYQVHVYLPGVAKDGATITLEKDNLLVEASLIGRKAGDPSTGKSRPRTSVFASNST